MARKLSEFPFTTTTVNAEFIVRQAGNRRLRVEDLETWIQSIAVAEINTGLLKTGDTMTGALHLAYEPTEPLEAATKAYVDTLIGGGTAVDDVARAAATSANNNANTRVLKAGDTLTGALFLTSGAPSDAAHAARKDYIDGLIVGGTAVDSTARTSAGTRVLKAGDTMTGALFLTSGAPSNDAHAARKDYIDGLISGGTAVDSTARASAATRVLKAGDTMTGALYLSANPTVASEAANKAYVDSVATGGGTVDTTARADAAAANANANTRVLKAGDTMTGALYLSGAPTLGNHAVTKTYADGLVAGGGVDSVARAAATAAQTTADNAVMVAGDTMTGALALADGTEALPPLTFSADLNTGFYRSTTDTIGVVAGGTMRFFISPTLMYNSVDYMIEKAAPVISINGFAGNHRQIQGMSASVLRWALNLGSNSAESGSDAGSNFSLARYDDAGALLSASALNIARSSGNVGINNAAIADIRLYVVHQSAEAVLDARSIRVLNANTADDASTNIEFATASGALRGKVRGQREGSSNHGKLVLSSALSGTAVDVLTLNSAGTATFAGLVSATGAPTAAAHLTRKDYVDAKRGSLWVEGLPGAGEILFEFDPGVAFTIPANLSGWRFTANVAATSSNVIDVTKNGAVVGTITFAAAGTVATLATSGGVSISFAANDILGIVAEGTQDATLANIRGSIVWNLA
jgi:hypothetical protein